MDVSADPSAEGFYVAMGAVRIAKVPSDAIPNRLIPRLRFSGVVTVTSVGRGGGELSHSSRRCDGVLP